MRASVALALLAVIAGCTDGTGAGTDAARTDGGATLDAPPDDAAAIDSGTVPGDGGGPADGSTPIDAPAQPDGGACAAMDARMGRDCGPTERPGRRYRWNGTGCEAVFWCECLGTDCDRLFDDEGACGRAYAGCVAGGCDQDSDCPSGAEWCEDGRCVACDNSGLLCLIACTDGWTMYQRNGCTPCACAPPNACDEDADCGAGNACYAGAMCWDWCPPGDPTCCRGNTCDAAGCDGPPPVGCRTRGCPLGLHCETAMGCASSSCSCGGAGGWGCTDDCGGGVCRSDTP